MLDLLDALDEEHPFRSLDRASIAVHVSGICRLLLSETRVQPSSRSSRPHGTIPLVSVC